MGAGTRKLGAQDSVLDHEVCVAEGCNGHADEEIFWGEVGGYRDGVDFVGFVELEKSEALILIRMLIMETFLSMGRNIASCKLAKYQR